MQRTVDLSGAALDSISRPLTSSLFANDSFCLISRSLSTQAKHSLFSLGASITAQKMSKAVRLDSKVPMSLIESSMLHKMLSLIPCHTKDKDWKEYCCSMPEDMAIRVDSSFWQALVCILKV
eukprot:TRINITY_DN13144_c0_g1_i5.p1 TRINITY_DN13144_c0_g1~~TRINITY_DN13144_c0_g1_i5.p1  ORF type:complete len:122 (-),score=4.69 TRINITY_DN13144_c0_g1_i5:242-607(-)